MIGLLGRNVLLVDLAAGLGSKHFVRIVVNSINTRGINANGGVQGRGVFLEIRHVVLHVVDDLGVDEHDEIVDEMGIPNGLRVDFLKKS